MSAERSPRRLSWALRCASLVYAAPDLPGRETVLDALKRYTYGFDNRVRSEFGGGLRVEGNPHLDANTTEPMWLRYAKPVLAPVLEAALPPGGVFVDVGANVGVYTLWAARCVGPEGQVHAFEPVPGTRAWLERNVQLNRFSNVTIIPNGLGERPGRLTLYCLPGASGLSSRYLPSKENSVEVDVTTLDLYFDGRRAPDLVKIDVEGMELEVLRGARRLLAGAQPPVLVCEAHPKHLEAAGTTYRELLSFLRTTAGYSVWRLGRTGIRPERDDAVEPASNDVVAARPEIPRHQRVLEKLEKVRFRDQELSAHTRILAALRSLRRTRA